MDKRQFGTFPGQFGQQMGYPQLTGYPQHGYHMGGHYPSFGGHHQQFPHFGHHHGHHHGHHFGHHHGYPGGYHHGFPYGMMPSYGQRKEDK
jgi:hypothetical protein